MQNYPYTDTTQNRFEFLRSVKPKSCGQLLALLLLNWEIPISNLFQLFFVIDHLENSACSSKRPISP
jgi:hypothetical protein